MNPTIKPLLVCLLAIVLFTQCHTATTGDKPVTVVVDSVPPKPVVKTSHHIIVHSFKPAIVEFDSIIYKLKNNKGLTKKDVEFMGINDTIYNAVASQNYPAGLLTNAEKTVQLNDSVLYSILLCPDAGGNCTYSFIVSIDQKNKKAIVLVYLNPDCDVDESGDSYNDYEHTIIDDTIRITKTIVYNKTIRVSTDDDDERNIDHREIHKTDYVILPNGEVELNGEN